MMKKMAGLGLYSSKKMKLIFSTLLLIAIVISCKRSIESAKPPAIEEFNSAYAKEWYYGQFKKSTEYGSHNIQQNGRKLPDWKNPIYRKVGNTEIIEFPLIKEKSKISVPSSNLLAKADVERITNASLTKIAFIKNKDGNIFVRELDYVPDWEFLKTKQYDISNVSMAKESNDFTGRLIIKTWGGNEISRWKMEKGIANTKIKMKAKESGLRTSRLTQCTEVAICEYARDCYEVWMGDYYVQDECGDWYPTGYCEYEEYCEEESCTGTTEECLCELYGLCGGGDGGDQQQCSAELTDFSQTTDANEVMASILVSQGTDTRTKNYPWVVLRGGLNMWQIQSLEQGVHKKVNNEWQWESLTHIDLSVTGTVIGGAVTPIHLSSTPTYGTYHSHSELLYKVKYSIACSGSPFETTTPIKTVGAYFAVGN